MGVMIWMCRETNDLESYDGKREGLRKMQRPFRVHEGAKCAREDARRRKTKKEIEKGRREK
jgi:hypothetical protein